MEVFTCTQHGCPYESEAALETCPVCNNPQSEPDTDVEAPWSDYSIGELREYAKAWELEGWNSRTTKPDLIVLLEAAEAKDDEGAAD